jgi:hypothetical protein
MMTQAVCTGLLQCHLARPDVLCGDLMGLVVRVLWLQPGEIRWLSMRSCAYQTWQQGGVRGL